MTKTCLGAGGNTQKILFIVFYLTRILPKRISSYVMVHKCFQLACKNYVHQSKGQLSLNTEHILILGIAC